METVQKETPYQMVKRMLSKTAVVTIMMAFWAALLVWPLYTWLTS